MPKSNKQEREIADYLNGKVQSNSGGTKFGGGDIHTPRFFIEAKSHTEEKSSFTVPKKWLEKAKEQAFEQGKNRWALAIRYSEADTDYFIISRSEMIEYQSLLDSTFLEE